MHVRYSIASDGCYKRVVARGIGLKGKHTAEITNQMRHQHRDDADIRSDVADCVAAFDDPFAYPTNLRVQVAAVVRRAAYIVIQRGKDFAATYCRAPDVLMASSGKSRDKLRVC